MYSCMHNSLKIVNYIGSACRALFILLSLFRPSASSLLLPVMSATSLKLRPAIVLFGDSITQQGFGLNGHVGWASLLANDYIRRADVLNRGFSGYNTRHCLELVPRLFGEGNILFCTVLLGANDAALPGERQHVPMDEYKRNIGKIVTSIRHETKNADLPIILMTPPPFDAATWDLNKPLPESGSRSNQAARAYGQFVKQAGAELHCPVLDVFEEMGGDGEDYGQYLSDGLHLNGEGNTKLYQGLMELIRRELPDLAPMEDEGTTGLPMEEKLWTELC